MGEFWELLVHLITYGPARNPAEAERLLALADRAGGAIAAAVHHAHAHPDNEPPAQASQEPAQPAQAPAPAQAPFGGTP